MKHILNKSILSFLLLLAMASCSRQWTDSGEKPEKLPRLKEKVFIEKMDSLHEMRPKYFYSKIKVTYADEDRKVSFKSSVNVDVFVTRLNNILSLCTISKSVFECR